MSESNFIDYYRILELLEDEDKFVDFLIENQKLHPISVIVMSALRPSDIIPLSFFVERHKPELYEKYKLLLT